MKNEKIKPFSKIIPFPIQKLEKLEIKSPLNINNDFDHPIKSLLSFVSNEMVIEDVKLEIDKDDYGILKNFSKNPKNFISYQGVFKNGNPFRTGKIDTNKINYMGEHHNLVPHGYGEGLYKDDNSSYKGQYKNGLFHGNGIYKFNGIKSSFQYYLSGYFEKGCFKRGRIKLVYDQEKVFFYISKIIVKNNNGFLEVDGAIFSKGSIYKGYFKINISNIIFKVDITGKGKMIFGRRSSLFKRNIHPILEYSGLFKDSIILKGSAKGLVLNAIYEGKFKNFNRVGIGLYIFPKGSQIKKIKGEKKESGVNIEWITFHNNNKFYPHDKKHKSSKIIFNDGRIYYGNVDPYTFNINGFGELISTCGCREKGIFKQGKFSGKIELIFCKKSFQRNGIKKINTTIKNNILSGFTKILFGDYQVSLVTSKNYKHNKKVLIRFFKKGIDYKYFYGYINKNFDFLNFHSTLKLEKGRFKYGDTILDGDFEVNEDDYFLKKGKATDSTKVTEGEFISNKDGIVLSEGKITLNDSSYKDGTFEKGKLKKGTNYISKTGWKYTGEFDAETGLRHGKGTTWGIDGLIYKGEWNSDAFLNGVILINFNSFFNVVIKNLLSIPFLLLKTILLNLKQFSKELQSVNIYFEHLNNFLLDTNKKQYIPLKYRINVSESILIKRITVDIKRRNKISKKTLEIMNKQIRNVYK